MRRTVTLLSLLALAGLVFTPAPAAPSDPGSVDCNDGTVTWSPTTLWPPNHKMQTITINYTDYVDTGRPYVKLVE